MRIAATIHQFPPDFETGTEILCLRTMQALAARGHEVQVFAADPRRAAGTAVRRETVEGVAVSRIATRRPRRWSLAARLRDEFSNPPAEADLVGAVAAFAPDIVHGYQAQQLGLAALPRLAALAPLVLTATDFHLASPLVTGAFDDGARSAAPDDEVAAVLRQSEAREAARIASTPGWRRLALKLRAVLPRLVPAWDGARRRLAIATARRSAARAALRAASAILAGSARIRDVLIAGGANPATTEVLAHAAPPVAVPARPVGTPLAVAFLGTIAPHKGPHVLLDAIDRLPPDVPLAFTLCGPAGPDEAYVQAIAARCAAAGRAVLRPPVAQAGFGALVGAADIVVVPSLWEENRPLVLLTALEAGRYVLTSDMPGLTAAFTPGQGGDVFAPGDAAALAAVLARLARDPAPVRAARAEPVRTSEFPAYIATLEARLMAAAS